MTSGSTAPVAENRKHASNDAKFSVLECVCVPLAVEVYGCWGAEAQPNISRFAAHLANQIKLLQVPGHLYVCTLWQVKPGLNQS